MEHETLTQTDIKNL
ncbi:Protein of unknown function [Lactobacillus helveticus CIRM-BIA 951]|uniref:Uncharacterized protein n=3 Tax=Lactobacillus helveticus TaxID=1587 RepID=U6F3I5_LACHE|nr:Protein of unknown function [Lactobacillus helveticus CIRM-BIA 951]